MTKKAGCPIGYRSKFDYDRRGNRIPSGTSWTPLAKRFNIGVLDLDSFADDMGYCDFDDLEISIGPKSLYRRSPKKFSKALRRNSLKGEKYSTARIGKLIL